MLIIAGIAHLVYAWSEGGLVTLTLVLAFYILTAGIFELAVFFRLRELPGAIGFLVDGLTSFLLADLIFFHWQSSSLWAVGTLVGISLLFSGMARITLPLSLRMVRA